MADQDAGDAQEQDPRDRHDGYVNDLLRESDVLAICRDAGIITTNIYNIMDGALKKRNAAAHPSTAVIRSATG